MYINFIYIMCIGWEFSDSIKHYCSFIKIRLKTISFSQLIIFEILIYTSRQNALIVHGIRQNSSPKRSQIWNKNCNKVKKRYIYIYKMKNRDRDKKSLKIGEIPMWTCTGGWLVGGGGMVCSRWSFRLFCVIISFEESKVEKISRRQLSRVQLLLRITHVPKWCRRVVAVAVVVEVAVILVVVAE